VLGRDRPLERTFARRPVRALGGVWNLPALRLREALNPYIYTLARRAYDTGLPITGALYLQWPNLAAAYEHPAEYTFGQDIVVEPVTADGDPAPATVWVPPGTWIDYFTGASYRGPAIRALSVPLSQMPVLVRAGAVIPTEPYQPYTPPSPQRSLLLTVFPGSGGTFALYDDQGTGFRYLHHAYAFTQIVHAVHGRRSTVTIRPMSGSFPGIRRRRSWELLFMDVRRPRTVRVDGHAHRFSYDSATRTVTLSTGWMRTDRAVAIALS
jgi:alpha-glucosidase (family GH31 glycosyl hydrolase)